MSRRPKKNPKTNPVKPTATPGLRDQILADFATLRVPVTAEQLDEVLKQAQDAGWSHLEFLHRLLADQAGLRRQRRIERLIKDARFREALPLSTFDWNFNPAIPRLKIEALAQVGAILALREFDDRDDKIPFFTGIEEAKFRRPVVPGDTLVLEVTALRIGSKVQKMRGVARVDGQITAEATIVSIIADRPKE